MENKIVVITGPTSGIGKVMVLTLARKGYRLVLLTRCRRGLAELIPGIKEEGMIDIVETDLSNMQSVRGAVDQLKQRYEKIDLLINNADALVGEKELTVDNIEFTFAKNHLGHFLLTTELLNPLKAAGNARVLHVSSEAHRFARFKIDEFVNPSRYIHFIVYANSKLANILFSNELSERYSNYGITSNAFHPGEISSGFGGVSKSLVDWFVNQGKPIFKNVEQGVHTAIFLATSEEQEGRTGGYYENQKLVIPSRAAQNKEYAAKLWELSDRLVKEFRG